MEPFLRWPGGKRRQAERIAARFIGRCEGTYYEPFMGSGAVFFHLRAEGRLPGHVVLSDINRRLMLSYLALRDDPTGVIEFMDWLPWGVDWRDNYFGIRKAYNEFADREPITSLCANLIWLNRAGFNGLYRENRKGEYNVPKGSATRLARPSREHLLAASALLQGTDLRVEPFHRVGRTAGEYSWIYADPPYVPTSATSFTSYASTPFDAWSHRRLADHLQAAVDRGAAVVTSNADAPTVRLGLYPERKGWAHEVISERRSIGATGESRGTVRELLAFAGVDR